MTPILANLAVLVALPWVLTGTLQRTRSLWTGRRGPPLLQPLHDVVRLARKRPVYSEVTTPLFRLGPWIALATTLATAAVVPLAGGAPMVSFAWDFVWVAYLWGLGRMMTLLAALDTGSPFEGMGASREATWATLLEPALFLTLGALASSTGSATLVGALGLAPSGGATVVIWAASLVSLTVFAQAEGSRVPIDDPATHLELTMIHEGMVLDHSGPDLAAIQTNGALKLTLALSLIASLLDPGEGRGAGVDAAVHLGACLALAVGFGTVEALIARLQLRNVPRYLLVAGVAGGLALLATTWQGAS